VSYPDAVYHGETGEVNAVFRASVGEPDLKIGQTEVRYLATGAATHGQFGLYRWDAPPRAGGPATHFHKTISESFFILSGKVRMFDGEQWINGTAGDFLYVPAGGLHAFSNNSDEPASLLMLFAPGALREGYFETLAEVASGRQMSAKEWADLFLQHDTFYARSDA
jgi:quercetin dioxygenase-like cupin family protein